MTTFYISENIYKKFFFYLVRWQLSTPVLWLCLLFLTPYLGDLLATIVANFIGGCIFFFVDRKIFSTYKASYIRWS